MSFPCSLESDFVYTNKIYRLRIYFTSAYETNGVLLDRPLQPFLPDIRTAFAPSIYQLQDFPSSKNKSQAQWASRSIPLFQSPTLQRTKQTRNGPEASLSHHPRPNGNLFHLPWSTSAIFWAAQVKFHSQSAHPLFQTPQQRPTHNCSASLSQLGRRFMDMLLEKIRYCMCY